MYKCIKSRYNDEIDYIRDPELENSGHNLKEKISERRHHFILKTQMYKSI